MKKEGEACDSGWRRTSWRGKRGRDEIVRKILKKWVLENTAGEAKQQESQKNARHNEALGETGETY